MQLYLNGRLVSEEPSEGIIKSAPLISIGRPRHYIDNNKQHRIADKEMVGQIDEVAIYDYALSQDEIAHHFRLGDTPWKNNMSQARGSDD